MYLVTVDCTDRYEVVVDGLDGQAALMKIERGEVIPPRDRMAALIARSVTPVSIRLLTEVPADYKVQ